MRLYLSSFRIGNRPDELLRLLDGKVKVALVVNADDYKSDVDRRASLEREIEELSGIGLHPEELDLRCYFDTPNLLMSALSAFDLVYVRGGNVFILRRAFRQSGADSAITELLNGDRIVYAGYSAGACVLGPTLHGLEGEEDDPEFLPRGYLGPAIWDGLGILPFAIAPHHQPGKVDGAIEYCEANDIPIVALRDGEALMIDGNDQVIVS